VSAVIKFIHGNKTLWCINTSQQEAQAFAAIITLERARAGDMSEIAERLRQNMLTGRERKWLAEYLQGKAQTRKRKGLSAVERSMLRYGFMLRTAHGWKREAAVKEVCEVFHVKRSYVYQLLKDKLQLARIKQRVDNRKLVSKLAVDSTQQFDF
jgi:hypothetical protein